MPLQWRNQIWQSLEEGAGKRARNVGRGISGELKEEVGERGWTGGGSGGGVGCSGGWGGGGRAAGVKPVLNWANVCSPNILRTLFLFFFLFT